MNIKCFICFVFTNLWSSVYRLKNPGNRLSDARTWRASNESFQIFWHSYRPRFIESHRKSVACSAGVSTMLAESCLQRGKDSLVPVSAFLYIAGNRSETNGVGSQWGAARRRRKRGRKDCMRDHCWKEQLPLDLFRAFIEIRSFIFPEIEIHCSVCRNGANVFGLAFCVIPPACRYPSQSVCSWSFVGNNKGSRIVTIRRKWMAFDCARIEGNVWEVDDGSCHVERLLICTFRDYRKDSCYIESS